MVELVASQLAELPAAARLAILEAPAGTTLRDILRDLSAVRLPVADPAVLAELLAVVGDDADDRVFPQAALLEPREQARELVVEGLYNAVGQADARMVASNDYLFIADALNWSAEATNAFDLEEFNAGSYVEAVAAKTLAENITMVLYPNDSSENGKDLRLRQQYFLASASLQDVMRQWVHRNGEDFSRFADKHCFQLNDTHPSIAVAELMRLLMDEHGLGWDQAWEITRKTFAFTNHTLLPEALEKWSVELFERLLPRHLPMGGGKRQPTSFESDHSLGRAIRQL